MSISADPFTPRWAAPPGGTLRDVLRERRVSNAQLATMMNISLATVDQLLDGRAPVTPDLAEALAKSVGATSRFWLAREAQYREDLSRVAADKWAAELPVRKMTEMGWIRKPADWKERLDACMRFFHIADVGSWVVVSRPILQSSYFRSSATHSADPNTVLAWLRQGEIVTADQQVGPWDRASFSGALPQVRALTRERDPSRFIPKLTDLCTQSGVRFAVVRAPQGCPVSGVARFVDGTAPMIILSARHLSDDHFWFTFSHEAGHLLLHDTNEIYLDDEQQLEDSSDSKESEANDFAQRLLIPNYPDIRSSRWLSHRDIIRKAHELGVSPGVLVGQLQHQGIVAYDTFNGLKRRYKWVKSSLERA